MTERKKKLIIIQISLLVVGSLIILFTYSDLNVSDKEKIITFDDVWKSKYVEGHPTQEGAENVSEVLYDSFNR